MIINNEETLKHKKYEQVRKEGWGIIAGSSKAYDKSIISLSTISLGFIFAVTKNSTGRIACKGFLIFILVLLILGILSSVLSSWLTLKDL